MNGSEEKTCQRCGYTWVGHIRDPLRCPSCGSYHWNEKPTVNTCVVCNHSWYSRTDSRPLRCPLCKTRTWRGALDKEDPAYCSAMEAERQDILSRYRSGQGCVRISMDTGLSMDRVIKTLKKEEDSDVPLRMRRWSPCFLTPASGAS